MRSWDSVGLELHHRSSHNVGCVCEFDLSEVGSYDAAGRPEQLGTCDQIVTILDQEMHRCTEIHHNRGKVEVLFRSDSWVKKEPEKGSRGWPRFVPRVRISP